MDFSRSSDRRGGGEPQNRLGLKMSLQRTVAAPLLSVAGLSVAGLSVAGLFVAGLFVAGLCGSLVLPGGVLAQEPVSPAEASDAPADLQQPENPAESAWQYLQALLAADYPRAGTFLTPDSHYQDFSMEMFGSGMVDLKGQEEILKFWRESAEAADSVEVSFDPEKRFVAGPNAYFIGTGRVKSRGKTWGVQAEYVSFSFTQISHIRVVEGKVTYHADHVDYAAFQQQLQQQRRRFGPSPNEDKKKK